MFRKVEGELRRTLQMLSDIQLALNKGNIVFIIDAHGFVVYANDLAQRIFGSSVDISHVHFRDFFIRNQEPVLQDLETCLRDNRVWQGQLKIESIERNVHWLQTSVVPCLAENENEKPYQYVCISTDITRQKETEFALAEREHQLRTLINALPETILFRDSEGRCIEANQKMLSLLDVRGDDWRDKTLSEMVSKTLCPACIQEWEELHHQESLQRAIVSYQTHRQIQNAEVYVEGSVIPVFNEDGSRHGAVMIERDVTELKHSQQELLAMKHELESLIEHSGDAVSITNLQGEILQVNPAFEHMFGWRVAEVVGQPIPFGSEEERLEVMGWIECIQQGGQISSVETVRHRKDGAAVHVSVTASPIRDKADNVAAMSVISRDITDNVKNKELLNRSEKLSMVGQMAAGVAHEIRNPLASLLGFTQLIRQMAADPLVKRYCTIMLEEFDRINGILNELLLLAKPQKAKFNPTNLTRILKDVVTLIQTQANEKNLILGYDFEGKDIVINCVENELKQVFINILKNAVEATAPGRNISLDIERDLRGQVVVRCNDQGCGIPKELISKLGEPFYTTKSNGTGLGLSVSHRIVQSHGGYMNIHSEENVGTTIEITFPVSQMSTQMTPSNSVLSYSIEEAPSA